MPTLTASNLATQHASLGPAYPINTFFVTGVSVTPASLNPGATLSLFGTVSCNTNKTAIVRYEIRERFNGNSTDIQVNSSVLTFVANVPQSVNPTVVIPNGTPFATYRVDVFIFSTDLSTTYLSVNTATTFGVTKPVLPFLLGVYKSAQDPQAIIDYEAWLGRQVDRIHDTLPSASWDDLINGGLNFFTTQWNGYQNRMVIIVPMIPTFGNYSGTTMSDADVSAALTAGAGGAYDSNWVTLRNNLVSAGFTNNKLRLGSEFNGGWNNWRANVNPSAWITYFQRIVGILRTGTSFVIDFNSAGGFNVIAPDTVYPGDAYVDSISVDIYDQDFNGHYPIPSSDTPAQALTAQQTVWHDTVLGQFNYGIQFWSTFSISHSKPFCVCEWGVYTPIHNGGGDDTYFIQSMHDFAVNPSNNVQLLSYFDLQGLQALYNSASFPTQFPNSSALYQQIFGQTQGPIIYLGTAGIATAAAFIGFPAPLSTYSVLNVFVSPPAPNPGQTLTIFGTILSNINNASVVVQYNIKQSNDAIVFTTTSSTLSLVANVQQNVNLTVPITSGTPYGTYRVDVKITSPDFATLYLYVNTATSFNIVAPGGEPSFPFLLGVYKGAQSPSTIAAYESWLGHRVDRINDTIPSDSWDNMINGGWGWFSSQWAGNETRMVLTIPMIPTFGNYGAATLNDTNCSAALAAGAAGAYDSNWITMRQDLINSGYSGAMIRLGSEMNGNWNNWRAYVNPTAWVAYWQRIVTILRNDPAARFVFNFNPTMGVQSIPADTVYPGDMYVDAIGLDAYDQDFTSIFPIPATDTPAQTLAARQQNWTTNILGVNNYGVGYWSQFAINHSKPFTICEWGLYTGAHNGGDDDTYYVQSMHDFAMNVNNRVTLLMYFDYDGLQALYNSPSDPTQFPNSSSLYLQLFGTALSPPVVIGDYALDFGMQTFHNNCDRIYVCAGPLSDFNSVTTTGLGFKNFGAGNAFGGITNGSPSGRVVTSIAFTDGVMTNPGYAAVWAAVDFANSHLLAWGSLLVGTQVNAGQTFGLPAFTIHVPAVFSGAGITVAMNAVGIASQAAGLTGVALTSLLLQAKSLALGGSAALINIDGIAHVSTLTVGAGTVVSTRLSTTQPNDYILVVIEANGGPIVSVTSAALGSLTFLGRGGFSLPAFTEEIWCAFSPGVLTNDLITVTQTSSNFCTVDAFGVGNSGQTSAVFDSGSPQVNNGTDPISITTTSQNTMVIAGFRSASDATPPGGFGVSIESNLDWQIVEYQVLTSPQTFTFGVGNAGSTNGSVAVALVSNTTSRPLFTLPTLSVKTPITAFSFVPIRINAFGTPALSIIYHFTATNFAPTQANNFGTPTTTPNVAHFTATNIASAAAGFANSKPVPDAFSITATVTPASAPAGTTRTITVTATGGTGPFTYSTPVSTGLTFTLVSGQTNQWTFVY